MKSDYKTRAIHFLEKYHEWFECNKGADLYDWREAVDEFNEVNHRAVKLCSGATRVALLTSDYVIKFDYGYYGSTYGTCEDEYKVYCRAVKENRANYLAECTKIIIDGVAYYIMPRANKIGSIEFFPKEMEEDIEALGLWDIHYMNVGMLNNKIVIIDYAAC